MLQNADNKLFSLMFRSSHCLHTLLNDLKVTDVVLRNSGTSFNLPHCSYKLYKQSFVNRCLFCDCYWYVLFCGTYMLFDLIWCIIFFSPHNWMAFVRLNKRHVMLCYVISIYGFTAAEREMNSPPDYRCTCCHYWHNYCANVSVH